MPKETSTWHETLALCVGDVVAMRPADPIPTLARMLVNHEELRPDLEEPTPAYVGRHRFEERIKAAIESASVIGVNEKKSAPTADCSERSTETVRARGEAASHMHMRWRSACPCGVERML